MGLWGDAKGFDVGGRQLVRVLIAEVAAHIVHDVGNLCSSDSLLAKDGMPCRPFMTTEAG